MRYELPIKGALTAWSLVAFVAAVGLLRRKNWARLLFMGLMAFAVLAIAWGLMLFTSLRLTDTSDLVACAVIAVGLGSIGWKLQSPSIVSEFRDGRS
jgi:cytochrome bd-type quinol oxidase subunit 1